MINFNFHQHSVFSDGSDILDNYVLKAIEMGFSAIGFSEHSPLSFENPFSLRSADVNEYVNSIDRLKAKYENHIKIYRALEMDYIPGLSTDFNEWKRVCNTDYLIGSVHLVMPCNFAPVKENLWFTDGPKYETYDKGLNKFFDGDIKSAVKTFYNQTNQMIETQEFDVLGHMDKIKMHNQNRYFTEDESWYQKLVDECLDLVKQKEIIVEVNTRGIYKKRSDKLFPDDLVLRKVKKMNIPVLISSDAHHPSELNLGFKDAETKLKETGFSEVMFFEKDKWVAVPIV